MWSRPSLLNNKLNCQCTCSCCGIQDIFRAGQPYIYHAQTTGYYRRLLDTQDSPTQHGHLRPNLKDKQYLSGGHDMFAPVGSLIDAAHAAVPLVPALAIEDAPPEEEAMDDEPCSRAHAKKRPKAKPILSLPATASPSVSVALCGMGFVAETFEVPKHQAKNASPASPSVETPPAAVVPPTKSTSQTDSDSDPPPPKGAAPPANSGHTMPCAFPILVLALMFQTQSCLKLFPRGQVTSRPRPSNIIYFCLTLREYSWLGLGCLGGAISSLLPAHRWA